MKQHVKHVINKARYALRWLAGVCVGMYLVIRVVVLHRPSNMDEYIVALSNEWGEYMLRHNMVTNEAERLDGVLALRSRIYNRINR